MTALEGAGIIPGAFCIYIRANEHKPTSDDGLFTLEIVSCLGACGLSPVVMVNDTVHASMTPEKARALVEELREEA